MLGILHIGNLKIGSKDWSAEHAEREFRAALNRLDDAERRSIEVLAVTGDITAAGTSDQYAAAGQMLRRLADLIDGPSKITIFPVPGPADLLVDDALFETFFVSFFNGLERPNIGQPLVIKRKDLSLVGIPPTQGRTAATVLADGIAELHGFYKRRDAVPKIVVSTASDLTQLDTRKSREFKQLCDTLRKDSLFDLQLVGSGTDLWASPNPFGLPFPSIGLGQSGGPAQFTLVRFSESNCGEGSSAEQCLRKLYVKCADDTGQIAIPMKRASQAFQTYCYRLERPDFGKAFVKVVNDIRGRVEGDGAKALIEVVGTPGSGKELLFNQLQNALKVTGHVLRELSDVTGLSRPDHPIVVFLDQDRHYRRGRGEIDAWNDNFNQWFVNNRSHFKSVIYICSPSDDNWMSAELKAERLRLTVDEDGYAKTLEDVARQIPVRAREMNGYFGPHVGFAKRAYDIGAERYERKERSFVITRSMFTEVLDGCEADETVAANATSLKEWIEGLHTPIGKQFVAAIEGRFQGNQRPLLPLNVATADILGPSTTSHISSTLQPCVDALESQRIIRRNVSFEQETYEVLAAFPLYVASSFPAMRIGVFGGNAMDEESKEFFERMKASAQRRKVRLKIEAEPNDIDDASDIAHVFVDSLLVSGTRAATHVENFLRDWVKVRHRQLCFGTSSIFFLDEIEKTAQAAIVKGCMPVGILRAYTRANAERLAEQLCTGAI